MAAMFSDGSKFWRTVFEKSHPRNIPVKLFKNQTRGFREEDFLRISSCPYFSPPPPPPPIPMAAMFFDGSKFREQVLKRNIPVKLFQNRGFREEDFCFMSVFPPPSPHGGHVLRQIKILRTIFEKGRPKNNLVE